MDLWSSHLEQGTEAATGFLGQVAGLEVEGGKSAGPGQGRTQGTSPAVAKAVALQGQTGQDCWLPQHSDTDVTLWCALISPGSPRGLSCPQHHPKGLTALVRQGVV